MLTDSHIFKVNTKQYSTIKNVFNFSSYHKNPSAYLLNYLYQLKYIVCIYIEREIYRSTRIFNKCDGWTQDLTCASQELYF